MNMGKETEQGEEWNIRKKWECWTGGSRGFPEAAIASAQGMMPWCLMVDEYGGQCTSK
jgi:hypothetical protein